MILEDIKVYICFIDLYVLPMLNLEEMRKVHLIQTIAMMNMYRVYDPRIPTTISISKLYSLEYRMDRIFEKRASKEG